MRLSVAGDHRQQKEGKREYGSLARKKLLERIQIVACLIPSVSTRGLWDLVRRQTVDHFHPEIREIVN